MLFRSVRWLLTTPVCIDVGVYVPIRFLKYSKNCSLYEKYLCDQIFFYTKSKFSLKYCTFLFVLITVFTRLSVEYTSYYPWSLLFLASTSHAKFNQNLTGGPWAERRTVKLFPFPSHNECLGLRNQMYILTGASLRNILFTDVSLSAH
jgi:hypothetical protein